MRLRKQHISWHLIYISHCSLRHQFVYQYLSLCVNTNLLKRLQVNFAGKWGNLRPATLSFRTPIITFWLLIVTSVWDSVAFRLDVRRFELQHVVRKGLEPCADFFFAVVQFCIFSFRCRRSRKSSPRYSRQSNTLHENLMVVCANVYFA